MTSIGDPGPEADVVVLGADDAHSLAVRCLGALGLSDSDARATAAHLLDASLSGYEFTGLSKIVSIAGELGRRPAPRPPQVVRETPASAIIDGGGTIGYVVLDRATDLVIAKARATGFGVVAVRNSFLSGRGAYYLERICRAGLAGFHVAAAPPMVAPFRGTRPALGTNPIAIGVPTSGDPVIFDGGTSALMWGEVQLKAQLGVELPPDSAIDAHGSPTTDAAQALAGALLPVAGHKGYGLGFMVQALALLSGSFDQSGTSQDFGFLHVAWDPELLIGRTSFEAAVDDLVRRVSSVPAGEGEEVRVPGERGFRERALAKETGIRLAREVYDALLALC
ncbi:Ldh family oxidoreductase [Geodermatophilus sp. URMC 64]